MNPGEFRHRTTINVKAETQQTDFGDFKETSSTNYTRFAKVKWLPGAEKEEAEVVSMERNIEFIYRLESISEELERIDTITYNHGGQDLVFYISGVQFTGHANGQYVKIKARTLTN